MMSKSTNTIHKSLQNEFNMLCEAEGADIDNVFEFVCSKGLGKTEKQLYATAHALLAGLPPWLKNLSLNMDVLPLAVAVYLLLEEGVPEKHLPREVGKLCNIACIAGRAGIMAVTFDAGLAAYDHRKSMCKLPSWLFLPEIKPFWGFWVNPPELAKRAEKEGYTLGRVFRSLILGHLPIPPAELETAAEVGRMEKRDKPNWLIQQPKSWSDVTISLDHNGQSDSIWVRVGSKQGRSVSAAELGMVHRQSKDKPRAAFSFLIELLKMEKRVVDSEMMSSNENHFRKKVERLNKALACAFGLSGEAIVSTKAVPTSVSCSVSPQKREDHVAFQQWIDQREILSSISNMRTGQYLLRFQLNI